MLLKALIFDIDGTLLDGSRRMSARTYGALARCAERGLFLCVATARPERLVFHALDTIPGPIGFLTGRGIYYNGALAVDKDAGLYRHVPLAAEAVLRLTELVGRHDDGLQVAIQREDDYHSYRHAMPDDQLITWGFPEEELLPYEQARKREASKIVIFAGRDLRNAGGDLSGLHRELEDALGDTVNAILSDSGRSIQAMAREATKGSAALAMLRHHGIGPEEAAVFGDDTPDAGMFGLFGCSVAMGQAPEALKKAATHVTRAVGEDGVAYALEEMLRLI